MYIYLLKKQYLYMHIIIYARLASKRIKNKPLIVLKNNKRLIDHVISDAKKIVKKDNIILATSFKKEDEVFKKIAKKNSINFFAGSVNNLIKRTYDCCKKFEVKYFLRYCADRPIVSKSLIKNTIKKINKKNTYYDLYSTNFNTKIDQGLTVEIFNFQCIKKIYKSKLTKKEKEHMANFIYNNKKNFIVNQIKFPKNLSKKNKYSLDTLDDLKKINKMLDLYNTKKESLIFKG